MVFREKAEENLVRIADECPSRLVLGQSDQWEMTEIHLQLPVAENLDLVCG